MGGIVRAVTNVVSSVVKAVVNVVSSVVKAVINVVADVINFVASPFMGLLGGIGNVPDAGAETARQDGVLIQKTGSREWIPIVYGYRKTAGKVIFAETGSTNNQYLWVAYVFSEGPVEGINEVWLDDTQLSATVVQQLNAGAIVDVPDTKYAGRVRYQWYPGVYFTNPNSSPIGTTSICKDAPSWKPGMVYNGCAVLFARYQWLAVTTQAQADANPFSGSIPQVQLSILGKKVASLVNTGFDGSGNPTGKIGSENYSYQGSGYTERYSTNPAEILLDYLRNPRYGKGLRNDDIDWDSFYTAAHKCNQLINYNSTVSGPILTLNYIVDPGATVFSNTKALLQNMRGYLPYIQGKYKLKIEDAGNPTDILSGAATIAATFTKDNIHGDIQYTAIDRTSKYNYVSVGWVDPDQKWSVQQVVYPETETERQTYIDLDGGRENNLETTMGGITNSQIAKDMARLLFNKSRYQESVSLKISAQGFELEPGDNIRIQSNILNFGDTPWRIVSIKLNEDYTFDLGCVRNPDFIYPYVQANTPDVVLPPYVPVGSTIMPPTNPIGQPVGLYPPVTAPLPPGVGAPANPITNPPVTNPTLPPGGGSGPPTSPPNQTPAPPPVPVVPNPLIDFVTIDRADYTYSGETAYVNITFRQPDNAQYKSLFLWYKPSVSTETVWTQIEISTRPGSGQNITQRIGPLLIAGVYNTYDVRTRVSYVTGEMSTIYGSTQFIMNGSATQDPTDTHATVTSGWTLNTTPVSGRRDDYFEQIVGVPQLSGGSVQNPRKLSIRVQQSLLQPLNPDIVGVKFFYKTAAATYWDEAEFTFAGGTYLAGQSVTVDFTSVAYIGGTGNPNIYNFIARWKYVDNSYSTRQHRFTTVDVANPVDPFYGSYPVNELVTAYSFQTVSQGVASGAIGDRLNMTISVQQINTYGVGAVPQNSIRFFVYKPDVSVVQYWRGVRVMYRPVTPGANPTYTTYDCLNAPDAAGFMIFDIPCVYDAEYQYVFVPLVYSTSGTRVMGNKAIFGQATVNGVSTRANYPTNGDWAPSFNLRREDTSIALGEIQSGFAQANPTIVVNSWSTLNEMPGWGEVFDAGSSFQLTHHYRLSFQNSHIANFSELHIYRRQRTDFPATYNSVTNPMSQGYGFWEKIVLTTAKIPTTPGLTHIINLRPPQSYAMSNSRATTQADIVFPIASTSDRSFRQIYSRCRQYQEEFIFVVKTTTGFSISAIFLPGAASSDTPYDILNRVGPPTTITWPSAIYESPSVVGWKKTFAEAEYIGVNQTSVPYNRLWLSYSQPTWIGSTSISSVTKPISYRLPAGGDTTGLGVI